MSKHRLRLRPAEETTPEQERRLQVQAEIRAKYPDQIAENKKKLCGNCSYKSCFLVPVTSSGLDCPYYAKRGK